MSTQPARSSNGSHAVVPTGNTRKPPPYMCKVCEKPILWDEPQRKWYHATMTWLLGEWLVGEWAQAAANSPLGGGKTRG